MSGFFVPKNNFWNRNKNIWQKQTVSEKVLSLSRGIHSLTCVNDSGASHCMCGLLVLVTLLDLALKISKQKEQPAVSDGCNTILLIKYKM